jgi:catechol 2,3-dioxygenase-like lactoylglutathione lyase family enzyme
MLADHVVFPILLATDLDASRAFYRDVLGLPILTENDERVLFACGGSSFLSVTRSTVGTADGQTQLAWRVPDIRAAVADLRARGIRIESYVAPDPVTDADGVADMGYVLAAWFTDPGGNVLAVVQPTEARTAPR